MLLIVPLGMATAPIFFKGTEHQELAYRYFKVLIAGNFLFPLGTTLSAFFLAQGKRWWVVWSSIAAYAVNLLLDTIFIFGIPSLVSPMGALGAAWSSLLSKFVFCLILFLCFLSKTHQATYKTHAWRVSLLSLWDCLRLCTPRAIGKAFAILVWTATTYLMVKKGGPYLSVLSIGSTLTLFCYFVSESVVQSLSVTISRFLGSKEYANLWKAWQFGIVFALIVSAVLAIPFLLFPDVVLSFFFSELPSGVEQSFFRNTIYWVWFWVFFNSLNAPQLAFLLAARKTVYYMLIMSLTWITSLLPIYYCLYHLEWSPHTFWFILSLDQLIVLLVNAFRVYFLSKSYRGNFQQVNVSINK
jgi:MATE family multidrug resistance protein